MNPQQKELSVTNAEFLRTIFPDLAIDEYCWTTAFTTSPAKAKGEWLGRPTYPGEVPETPFGNSYFCVTALRPDNKGAIHRRKENFGRLMCVVLDDADQCDLAPTWKLETSPNNYQIGFILDEPISDLNVAERLHAALGNLKLIRIDKSGNNVVRYVRLPVGVNTKYEGSPSHRLDQWNPDLRVSLQDLCGSLGIDFRTIKDGLIAASTPSEPTQRTGDYVPDKNYYQNIASGESFHDSINIMAARLNFRGMSESNIIETMQGVMELSNDGSERWQSRYDDIPRSVKTAVQKFTRTDLAMIEPPTGDSVIEKLNAVFGDQLGSEYEAPDELVEGLMTIGSAVVVYGDSNSGKTFWALSVAASVAMGTSCYGRRTDPGLVVYLASESPASIRSRIQALKKYHNDDLENLVVVQAPVNFYLGDGDATDVIGLVKTVEHMKGQPVRLIVGDTLARISAGANENSGEDMGPVMSRFDVVAAATKACIMIIHHNGKDAAKGSRGWSGIRAHIDTEIEVNEKEGVRSVTVTKQRELPSKGDAIYFKLHVIEMGITKFGKPATTCVAIPDDESQTQNPHQPLTKHDQNVQLLERAWRVSGAEMRNNSPYLTRSALIDVIVADGNSQRTAENKVEPGRKNGIIMPMLNAGVMKPFEHGWIFVNPTQSTAMVMLANNENR